MNINDFASWVKEMTLQLLFIVSMQIVNEISIAKKETLDIKISQTCVHSEIWQQWMYVDTTSIYLVTNILP